MENNIKTIVLEAEKMEKNIKIILDKLLGDGCTDCISMLQVLCDGEYLATTAWKQEDVEAAHEYLSELVALAEIEAYQTMNVPFNSMYLDGYRVVRGTANYTYTSEEADSFLTLVLNNSRHKLVMNLSKYLEQTWTNY